jgi:hypothetical protein
LMCRANSANGYGSQRKNPSMKPAESLSAG